MDSVAEESMPDLPSDLTNTTEDRHLGTARSHTDATLAASRGHSHTETASLAAQTPGLDRSRPLRDAGVRLASWMRERPGMLASILGGIFVAGVGTALAVKTGKRSLPSVKTSKLNLGRLRFWR
jgi:hypothetical protein